MSINNKKYGEILENILNRHEMSLKENELTEKEKKEIEQNLISKKDRVEERYLVNTGGSRPYYEYLPYFKKKRLT